MLKRFCVPGQRLSNSNTSNWCSGPGTYERNGYIYAQYAGTVHLVDHCPSGTEISTSSTPKTIQVLTSTVQTTIPSCGDIVTAQVQVLTHQYAKCVIRCVGDVTLRRSFKAIVRREDIRATEKDKVEIFKCFRPGDIILARVLPVTEAHTYHLSTAENHLGVAIAYSEAGYPMVPISWTEMQCTRTYAKEDRKVAKIVPETSSS